MSKGNEGFHGLQRGKIGNYVYYVVNGQQRVRPYRDKKTQPNSPAQLAARFKIGRLNKCSSALAYTLSYTMAYQSKVLGITPRNVFVKRNKDCFVSEPTLELDFEHLVLGEGRLGGVTLAFDGRYNDEGERDNNGLILKILTSEEEGGIHLYSDLVVVTLYCPDFETSTEAIVRKGEAANLRIYKNWQGHTLWAYGVAYNTLNIPRQLPGESKELQPMETSRTACLRIEA